MLLRRTLLHRPDGKSATKGAPRRSARIPVAVSVTISGKDTAGNSFREATRTVEIDRQGARILTTHQLAPGSQLSVENTSLGQTALARVVECGDRRSRAEPFQVEVELVELPELFDTASIWGVKARDREEGSPRGAAAGSDAAPARSPQPMEPAPAVSTAAPDATREAVHPGVPAGGPATGPIVQAAAQTPAASRQATVTPPTDGIRIAAEEAVAGLQKTRLEMQGSLESRAAQHQRQLAEMAASSVRELDRKSKAIAQEFMGVLDSSLEASRHKAILEFEGCLQKAATDQETQAVAGMERQAAAIVQRLTADLKGSAAVAGSETEHQFSNLGKVVVEKIARQADALGHERSNQLVETFEQRAGAVLRTVRDGVEGLGREAQRLTEKCRSGLAEASDAQVQRVAESTRAEVDSLREAANQLLAELTSARQATESGLAIQTGETEQKLAQLASRLDEMDRRSKAWLDLAARTSAQPGGFPGHAPAQRDVDRAAEELRDLVQELIAHSTSQIQERTRLSAEAARDELSAWAKQLADDAGHGRSVAAAAIESFRGELGSIGEQSRHDLLRVFEEHAATAAQSARALVEPLRGNVEKAAAGLRAAQEKADFAVGSMAVAEEKAVARLEDVERRTQASLAQFETASRDAMRRSTSRLAEQGREVEQETGDTLRATSSALVEDTRKQAAAITQGTLDVLARQTATVGEESLARLRALLDEFVSRSSERVRALDDARLDEKCEEAKRQKATLEKLRVEFTRTERRALRSISAFAKGFTASALSGLGSSLKLGLKVGISLAALAAVLITCLSIRPVMRLRSDPPKEFYDEYLELDARKRQSERSLALAYWECARAGVQAKYAFGQDLPDAPPGDFRIDDSLFAAGARIDPASRVSYWARLRLVWLLPQSWDKSYAWRTDWIHALTRHSTKGVVRR